MKKTERTVQESLEQIKLNMNYELGKTLNEQVMGIEPPAPGTNLGYDPNELQSAFINRAARVLKRNYSRIDSMMGQLQGKTYQNKPAIEGVKTAYKSLTGKDLPNSGATTGVANTQPTPAAQTFRPAQGTPQDPYVVGTSGDGVSKVQQYLGGLKVDGMFDQTKAALAQKVPQFSDKFTNNDLITIYKTIYPQTAAEPADTSKINMSSLAPKVDTTKLASTPTPGNETD